jgi:hypothetical protein
MLPPNPACCHPTLHRCRCLRLSLYGFVVDGPIGHVWYQLLDRYVYPEAPTSNRAVLAKTAADQLVWGPAMTLIFFAFLKLLEGSPDLIWSTIQERFWPVMIANYAIWCAAVHGMLQLSLLLLMRLLNVGLPLLASCCVSARA